MAKNLYEKIKNKSIDEMVELLTHVYIGGFFSFFSFVPDEDFIKSLPNYDEFYNTIKSKLMEEVNDV